MTSLSKKAVSRESDIYWSIWKHLLLSVLFFLAIGIMGNLAHASTVRGYSNSESCWRDVEDEKEGKAAYRYSETSPSEIDFHVSGSSGWYELDGKCYKVNQTLRRMGNLQTSVTVIAGTIPVSILATSSAIVEGAKKGIKKVIGWLGGYVAIEVLAEVNEVPGLVDIYIDLADTGTAEAWKNPCSVILEAASNFPGGGTAYYECLQSQPRNDGLHPSQRIPAPRPPPPPLACAGQDQMIGAAVEIGVPKDWIDKLLKTAKNCTEFESQLGTWMEEIIEIDAPSVPAPNPWPGPIIPNPKPNPPPGY